MVTKAAMAKYCCYTIQQLHALHVCLLSQLHQEMLKLSEEFCVVQLSTTL